MTVKNPAILLVNSACGDGSIDSIISAAESQVKGCYASTKPRLLLDVWNTLSDAMSELNAHYIVIPTRVAQAAGKFPVILNTGNKGKILALMNPPPQNKHYGYYAFCGTAI
jgi:hypothetical protein